MQEQEKSFFKKGKNKLKKQIRTLSIIICSILCVALFSACSVVIDENGDMIFETEEDRVLLNAETEAEEETEAIPEYPAIGTVKTGDTVLKVELMNLTGQEITGFALKEASEEEFGENLLSGGDPYAADEIRILYWDMEGADLSCRFDVEVTLADESVYVLHSFPFYDIYEGRICLVEDVLFLEYVSPWTGKEVVTRTSEIDIREAERLEKEKEEAERIAAEEEAARQAAEEAAAWQAQQEQQWAQQQWQQQQWQQQQWQQEYVAPQDNSNAGCIGDDGLMY